MAVSPRPIGSTVKPFIYTQAFEEGARPYTLVDDREYRFEIGTGFALYPKNFDGQYRGLVTLHQALSNSLNVPSVKTLEFVGVNTFGDLLEHTLGFRPRQSIQTYSLGIALGGLEMDPLTLANYFTVFQNEGVLKPLAVAQSGDTPHTIPPPMAKLIGISQPVFHPALVELTNKILSDRQTGVDQFGIKSNLNLTATNYAVKTGTSYNYHDSWTVGYTPDFLVAVWLGNSDNTAIHKTTGQSGAGRVWHDTMELLLNSPYNKKTPFTFSHVASYMNSGSLDYGLEGDNYDKVRNLLIDSDIILTPHDGDEFLYDPKMRIPLRSRGTVQWLINGVSRDSNQEFSWTPPTPGKYKIEAIDANPSADSAGSFGPAQDRSLQASSGQAKHRQTITVSVNKDEE